jgi:NADPH-dependent curcumin reductase CurA
MANRQIVLEQLPQGRLSPANFRLQEAERPTAGEGQVLVRTRYVSLDAANRAWMQGATYRAALQAGDVMAGGALAEVVESQADHLKPGDFVFADTGWQDYAALPGKRLSKLPDLKPLTHLLSVYGVAGLTAYHGLIECGRPQPGETVVVSAAAGSVGSIVGQIAKIKGSWPTMAASPAAARCRKMTARPRPTVPAACPA